MAEYCAPGNVSRFDAQASISSSEPSECPYEEMEVTFLDCILEEKRQYIETLIDKLSISKNTKIENQINKLEIEILCILNISEYKKCSECQEINDSRLKKHQILRHLYEDVLLEKDRGLMCMYGVFNNLGSMVNEGTMDSLPVPRSKRCSKCRQVSSKLMTEILKKEFFEVLAEENEKLKNENGKSKIKNCSVEFPCSTCLEFLLSRFSQQCRTADDQQPETFNGEPRVLSKSLATRKIQQIPNDHLPEHFLDQRSNGSQSREKCVEELMRDMKEISTEAEHYAASNHGADYSNEKLLNTLEKLTGVVSELSVNCNCKKNDSTTTQLRFPLTFFEGHFWEDPKLIIWKWENELKILKYPKSRWTIIVSRYLQGRAKIWWYMHNRSDNIPWESFVRKFLQYYEDKYIMKQGIICFLRNCSNQCLDNILKEAIISAICKIYDDDERKMWSSLRRYGWHQVLFEQALDYNFKELIGVLTIVFQL